MQGTLIFDLPLARAQHDDLARAAVLRAHPPQRQLNGRPHSWLPRSLSLSAPRVIVFVGLHTRFGVIFRCFWVKYLRVYNSSINSTGIFCTLYYGGSWLIYYDLPGTLHTKKLLRGAIVNRTCGIDKNLSI